MEWAGGGAASRAGVVVRRIVWETARCRWQMVSTSGPSGSCSGRHSCEAAELVSAGVVWNASWTAALACHRRRRASARCRPAAGLVGRVASASWSTRRVAAVRWACRVSRCGRSAAGVEVEWARVWWRRPTVAARR
ncbi:hypothetical protein J8M50_40895 [Streptomyces acidiscabies]|nr:hypothetical protein [Streptomyces acidiscabies]